MNFAQVFVVIARLQNALLSSLLLQITLETNLNCLHPERFDDGVDDRVSFAWGFMRSLVAAPSLSLRT